MGIFRGIGGTGNSTDDGVVDAVTEQAVLATNKATEAANSASSASASATSASNSATSASTSATTATTKASEASNSATSAATSATSAATSATSASASATTATTKASEAATSATNAATSETNAATSATTATTKASEAATSATTATTKASEASTSATNAASSATSASTSASTATTKASEASTSAASAASSYDDFDDRYLGAKSSAPTVDNDGDALITGALYFDTSSNAMKVYSGSSWLDAYASLSGALIATNNLSDLNNVSTARTNLGLGTAATTASTDYATAAQGTTADNALPKSGGAMTGAITTNSTFDGRDVSADGAKLDGIEASADVTDTANVTAAGALMDSEVTNLAQVKAFDSADYATAAQGSTADSALQNVVEDTTPQLGGNLDINSNNITGTGNITVTGYLRPTYTDSSYMTLQGYGIEFNRATNYLRPTTDGDKTLYLSASDSTKDWSKVHIKTHNGTDITGSLRLRGGSWASGTDTSSTVAAAVSKGNFIFSDDGNYLRIIAGHNSSGKIQIGQSGTSLITGIDLYSGTSGNNTLTLNGNKIWNAGNDGSGSGLDADTCDGQHLGSTAAVQHRSLTYYNSTSSNIQVRIDGSGDSVAKMYWKKGSTNLLSLDMSGNLVATGNVTAYSDARLKDNIKPISNALTKLDKISGNTYTRNDLEDTEKKYAGVIAQEVEAVLPEAVVEVEDGTKAVDYNATIALLIEAVKELKAEVNELKGVK